MELNNLKYVKGSRGHKTKTVGRGYGSGMGKRSTRGQKGQHARKSGNVRQGFEGGQTPIYRRIPKVGFNNFNFATKYEVITFNHLINLKDKVIDKEVLIKNRLVSKTSKLPVKVIASKDVKLPSGIEIKADKFTAGAKKAIESFGSKATIIKK